MKIYDIADRPTVEERALFGLKMSDNFNSIKAILSTEYRCPKKGEWYISGAIPQAYRAENDLSMKANIAKLVLTETKTITTVKIIK